MIKTIPKSKEYIINKFRNEWIKIVSSVPRENNIIFLGTKKYECKNFNISIWNSNYIMDNKNENQIIRSDQVYILILNILYSTEDFNELQLFDCNQNYFNFLLFSDL